MTLNRTALALAAIAAVLATTQAQAHARLVSASPASTSTSAAPKQIVLKFGERLQPRFSAFDVSRGGARVPMASAVGKDRQSLTATPAKPLAPGAYKVAWHAVTADTHRMQGSYSFTVR